jgi:hypothetical protein
MQSQRLDFTSSLAFLQTLIGTEVRVSLNLYGQFLGAGFQGELAFIRSLPPDISVIQIVLRGGHGLFLDPDEVEATLIGEPDGRELLELHSKGGLTVSIEAIAEGF